MKTLIYIILLFGCLQDVQAQETSGYRIIRSSLGSSGSSQTVVTTNGTYKVSQSIGQASVIGTHFNKGYYLRQGYQQPLRKINVAGGYNYNLEAKVFPNPFNNSITITFSTSILNDISVILYDVEGKIIHSDYFLPAQKINLKINSISSGTYLLKVTSGRQFFDTKLIKI